MREIGIYVVNNSVDSLEDPHRVPISIWTSLPNPAAMAQTKNFHSVTNREVNWVESSEGFRILPKLSLLTASIVSALMVLMPSESAHSQPKCPNMQTSIEIIDESGGRKISGKSVESLANSPFKTYVTTVSQYVATKIGEAAKCSGNASNSPEIKLFFVYRSVSVPSKLPTTFSLPQSPSPSARSLRSPWATISIGRAPKLSVSGLFVWNERQFLLDQALLAGARVSPPSKLLPLDDRTFERYVQDYTDSVLLAASPEAKSVAQSNISNRLPAEILWLFRHAWQSTFAPFSSEVDSALEATIEYGASGYGEIAKVLTDRAISSTKTDLRYRTVLDLKNIFAMDKYRINPTSIRR